MNTIKQGTDIMHLDNGSWRFFGDMKFAAIFKSCPSNHEVEEQLMADNIILGEHTDTEADCFAVDFDHKSDLTAFIKRLHQYIQAV